MLDTLPYADLLAIHNALAEKPARRFDTRANGEKRTLALIETRGLTLEEATRLADVVLALPSGDDAEPQSDETVGADGAASPEDHADAAGPDGDPPTGPTKGGVDVTVLVAPNIAPLVSSFVDELLKPERPRYLATFLRRLNGGGIHRPRLSSTGERQMTASQRKIVELCSRPEGATGKELAEGCGWPSIAARPIVYRYDLGTCHYPRVHGITTMVNSIFNGWRLDDAWLD